MSTHQHQSPPIPQIPGHNVECVELMRIMARSIARTSDPDMAHDFSAVRGVAVAMATVQIQNAFTVITADDLFRPIGNPTICHLVGAMGLYMDVHPPTPAGAVAILAGAARYIDRAVTHLQQ